MDKDLPCVFQMCLYCGKKTKKFGDMWACFSCRVMTSDVDIITWDSEIQRLPFVLPKGLLLVRNEQPE